MSLDEWPHPTNPTEIRKADDGRIALHFIWRGENYEPGDGWVVVSTPNGILTWESVSPDDVAKWAPV